MHCRWAVTLRPVARNSSVSSSGVLIAVQHYHQRLFFNNHCRYGASRAGPARRPAGFGGRSGGHGAPVTCGRLWPCPTAPRRRAGGRPVRPPRGPRPAGHRVVRRPGHRRRHHRGRRGARRGQPGAEDRPGREGRLRLGHVVQVLQAHPRRSPLPPAARVPAGLREPGRAATTAGQRPPPGVAPPLPHPPVRQDGRGQQERGPGLPHRPVALRPDRRGAHRPPPREGHPGPGPGPHAHPAGRPAGRRLPLLGRPVRRRPADPDRAAHRRARPRRGGRQPHPGRPAWSPAPDGRVGGATVDPRRRASRSTSGPRWWSTPPGCGPTRSAPSTRGTTPTPSGRPRASTSPCPRRPSRATSPPSSRSGRTTARSSWCPGATRSTWAPPTPPGTARSTTRRALPEDVDYILDAANAVSTRRSAAVDITGIWSGLRPLLAPVEGSTPPASAPPTCPAATPCAPRTAAWSPSPAASSPPTARWPRTPSTPRSASSAAKACGA